MTPLDTVPTHAEAGAYYAHARTEIEPLVPAAPVSAALEIGCGSGGTMAWLRSIRQVRYACAVELEPKAAEQARTVFDEVEVGSVEAATFAFRPAQYDLILALDVLEHLRAPEETVRRLLALLSRDGVLIASIPNIGHYSASWPLVTRGRWEYKDEGILDRTHLRFFDENSVRRLFTDNGFTNVSVTRKTLFPNVFSILGLRGRKWTWYSQKLLAPVLRWPRHLFVVQFLVVARSR